MGEPIIVPQGAAWYVRVGLATAIEYTEKFIADTAKALVDTEAVAGVWAVSLKGALDHKRQLLGEMRDEYSALPDDIRPHGIPARVATPDGLTSRRVTGMEDWFHAVENSGTLCGIADAPDASGWSCSRVTCGACIRELDKRDAK